MAVSTWTKMAAFSGPAEKLVVCMSVAISALTAGGIFVFPLLSGPLQLHLKLTQPQLTTIALAGMIGQYPFGTFVGKITDMFGPWASSLAASILYGCGFGIFSWEIHNTPDDIIHPSQGSFYRLSASFFLAGLATVFAFFSIIFASSKALPRHVGLASGASTALFGLSPMVLTLLAANFFTNGDGRLNVTFFTRFLAILASVAHATSAIGLKLASASLDPHAVAIIEDNDNENDDDQENQEPDERQSLISRPRRLIETWRHESVWSLFTDPYFWILFSVLFLTLGSCEMVISNIGTIAMALPSSSYGPAKQVWFISLANTMSRLFTGPLADYVAPVAIENPLGERVYPRKHFFSRIAFMSGAAILLFLIFVSTAMGVHSQKFLWMLSIGTGIAYGTSFTMLPGIVSAVWGTKHAGRNFGMAAYAVFVATPVYSYLYAFVSEGRKTNEDGICLGAACWRPTFLICGASALLALGGTFILWRKWKGLL